MPTLYNTYTYKAKKEHKCCECRGKICVGEKYHSIFGIWEGEPYQFKTCSDCELLRNKMIAEVTLGEPIAFGFLSEELIENSETKEYIKIFLDICKKRGVEITPFWFERLNEL